MLPSEQFPVGARVRYVGNEHPDEFGWCGTVTSAPRESLIHRQAPVKWLGMRVWFDGEKEPVIAWPDQFELIGVVERLADLAHGE